MHTNKKLENILCHKKREKIQKKGVYSLNCGCNREKIYIGQTKVNIATRMKQLMKDVEIKGMKKLRFSDSTN